MTPPHWQRSRGTRRPLPSVFFFCFFLHISAQTLNFRLLRFLLIAVRATPYRQTSPHEILRKSEISRVHSFFNNTTTVRFTIESRKSENDDNANFNFIISLTNVLLFENQNTCIYHHKETITTSRALSHRPAWKGNAEQFRVVFQNKDVLSAVHKHCLFLAGPVEHAPIRVLARERTKKLGPRDLKAIYPKRRYICSYYRPLYTCICLCFYGQKSHDMCHMT